MEQLLYSLYHVPIIGKTRKELAEIIAHEKKDFGYALLTKNHITFSKEKGISFVDALIAYISRPSFIYIEKGDNENCFVLVYIKGMIVHTGIMKSASILNRISLYLTSAQAKELKIYTYQYQLIQPKVKFTIDIVKLDRIPIEVSKSIAFSLRSIPELQGELNRKRFLLGVFVIFVLSVAIGAGLMVHHYHQEKRIEQQKEKAAQIDPWEAYHHAIAASNASIMFGHIFGALSEVDSLPLIVIKNFDYKAGLLSIKAVSFGFPILRLRHWATNNGYNFSLDHSDYILKKSLIDHTTKGIKKASLTKSNVGVNSENNTIRNALSVSSLLVDQITKLFSKNTITYMGKISNKNYQTIGINISFDNQPIKLINELFQRLSAYPIFLKKIDGYVALGNYNGTVELNIIGD